MLELYMYWSHQFKIFMVQEPLMFAWFCLLMGAALQYLFESLIDG